MIGGSYRENFEPGCSRLPPCCSPAGGFAAGSPQQRGTVKQTQALKHELPAMNWRRVLQRSSGLGAARLLQMWDCSGYRSEHFPVLPFCGQPAAEPPGRFSRAPVTTPGLGY